MANLAFKLVPSRHGSPPLRIGRKITWGNP
jgi:hypothetical protein